MLAAGDVTPSFSTSERYSELGRGGVIINSTIIAVVAVAVVVIAVNCRCCCPASLPPRISLLCIGGDAPVRRRATRSGWL